MISPIQCVAPKPFLRQVTDGDNSHSFRVRLTSNSPIQNQASEHDKIKYSYSVVCPIVVYNGVVPVQEGAWGENPACREVAPCNPGSSVPACRAAVCAAVFVQPDMQFHHPLHAITT